jgi:FkbM family methyltransferase
MENQFRTAVDIGAHIGKTTVRYASNFQKVHSLEPIYINYLKTNTRHFSNIVYHDVAASNRVKTFEMFFCKNNSGLSIIKTPEVLNNITKNKYDLEHTKKVLGMPLDELLSSQNDIDFIKIDTEGFVLPVFQGMRKTIRENKPLIQVEFNSLCSNTKECIDYIENVFEYEYVDEFESDRFYKPCK